MGLIKRLAEEREREIFAHATPHIEDQEEVVHWVRSRRVEGRGRGFVFLTSRRVVVSWPGNESDNVTFAWRDISDWGVNKRRPGGPILGIKSDEDTVYVKMPVTTSPMARNVSEFLRRFAQHAPMPHRTLTGTDGLELDEVDDADVDPEKKSLAEQTKRILKTVLGAVMVVGGLLITPLPGPWSFPIIIGGLAVLATEYDWAEDTLNWVKHKYRQAAAKVKRARRRRATRDGR